MKRKVLLLINVFILSFSSDGAHEAKSESKKVDTEHIFFVHYEHYTINSLVKFAEIKLEVPIKAKTYLSAKVPLPEELQTYIWQLCKKEGLSYRVVLSLIGLESEFNSNKVHVNKDGSKDYGIMQLNDGGTMQWLANSAGIENFKWEDPKQNIHAGIWYLNYLKDLWDDKTHTEEELTYLVLLSYNMGPGRAKTYVKKHQPTDWKYIQVVYQRKHKLFGDSVDVPNAA